MSAQEAASRSVVVEKDYAHSPEKVWRALTEGPLLEQWLMRNDFAPQVGHGFQFRMEPMPQWDGVIDCKVLTVEPPRRLAYTWGALGLESVVEFTLTPTAAGTHLRMEHSGFGPDQEAAYRGATYGWQNFTGKLEGVLAEVEG